MLLGLLRELNLAKLLADYKASTSSQSSVKFSGLDLKMCRSVSSQSEGAADLLGCAAPDSQCPVLRAGLGGGVRASEAIH